MAKYVYFPLVLALTLLQCQSSDQSEETGPVALAEVDDEFLQRDDHGEEWPSYGLNSYEDRFSPLHEININNVSDLSLAWSLDLGTKRGIEATPLVVNGVMYLSGPWSKVFAINARTGTLLWLYDPAVPRDHGEKACCDVVNRGVALYKGRVYVGTLDGRLVAINATTGTMEWETMTVDSTRDYTITGAPRIANGMVLIGNGGAEYGVRGYVSAYDAGTGEQIWRTYTVPGNPAEGFESTAMEKAADTWSGSWWEYGGGGTVWDAMAFDPDLNLIYIGTGNGSPWDRNYRSPEGGDNLYLSSILALNPADGSIEWHYQTTPGDTWDFTATQHIILADMEIEGQERKVLMQAPKNGFFYVLDRTNGELISAEKFTYVNWATHVNMETGKPVETPFARFEDVNAMISPNYDGGHNWQPMAYNKNTGLVYIPVRETGAVYGHDPNWTYQGESGFASGNGWNLGTGFHPERPLKEDPSAPENMPTGKLLAWDPVKQEEAWHVSHTAHSNGGILTTAGNLVFQGTSTGYFVAYDATNGNKLWDYFVGSGVIAAPSAYLIDNEMYVSIAVGWGGAKGTSSKYTEHIYPGRVFTFKIGGTAPEVVFEDLPEKQLVSLPVDATEEQIQQGSQLFTNYCAMCHSSPGSGGGAIPDLAYSTPEIHQSIKQIVLEGLLLPLGMPKFKGRLTEENVENIQAFILSQAAQKRASI